VDLSLSKSNLIESGSSSESESASPEANQPQQSPMLASLALPPVAPRPNQPPLRRALQFGTF
jgi:hypothetical protein